MRRCILWLGIMGIGLLGMDWTSSAARTHAGFSNSATNRHARVGIPPRDRPHAASPLPESLELPRPPEPSPALGEVSAAAAILLDGETGEVLFARNPDEPRPPASTTKILTALVILERGRLADTVVVSQTAARVGGYRLGLRQGQRISLEDLLAAILIRSANDAATAAAEHVGPGLPSFVALMNAKAQELGMRNSHFSNPHGLDEPMHFSTARDMALLARAAMEHPQFAGLVRARGATVSIWKPGRRARKPVARTILSHNRLLGRLDGADGVKTGYTEAAGQCLVASATRGGHRMIAVLFNDRQRWTNAAALLEFGFGSVGGTGRMPFPVGPWRPVPSVEEGG